MSQAKQAEELKRVAIWIRVSTEDQAKGESPEHHEHRARAYAEIRGWQVVTLYNLAGVSGKAVMAHPEARRMMDDVKAHRITGLIFSKLARLARNTKELLEFAEFFKSQDADLISLEESIDTSTPAGRFFYTVIAGIAAWEREEIAARVAASVPVRAKLGKPLGGAAPFGYLWKEKKLVPHPEEAPIRRLIYELFREHKRLKTVGQTLTSRGLRTRRGKRFSDTTLRRLIEDSTAKGEHLANYTRSRGDGKSWDLKPAGEWVTTAVEPLISAELWAECNALLAERTRTRKPPTKRPVNLFAGLVHCTCGGSFRVPSSIPNKYVCNACHRKIPVVDLERLFQTELERFVLSPEAVAAHLADGDAVLAGKEELLTALLGERERLAREAEKLYRLYLADALSVEGFGAKHRPLEERLRQLDEEVPHLQGEIDFLKMSLLNQADVLSEAHDLYHRFGDLPFEDRRAIVEAIVERITIGGEEIELALAALPPFPKMTAFGQRTPGVASYPSTTPMWWSPSFTRSTSATPWVPTGSGLPSSSAWVTPRVAPRGFSTVTV
jgi:site-specific DNA recombinase